MKLFLQTLLLLLISTNTFAITQINVAAQNDKDYFQGYSFVPPYQKTTHASLDLGENLSGKIVRIAANDGANFKVHLQLETSLTIMDEGPHLDLINWKHCTTEWIKVETESDSEFILPVLENIDVACFPKVTAAEIRAEALKQGGERWANLIKQDASINDYPFGTALSMVRIKIEENIAGEWQTVTVLLFSIPMGC